MNHDEAHGLRVQLATALRERDEALSREAMLAIANKALAGDVIRCAGIESERDALRDDVKRLRSMLEKGTARIRILLDRMQGCDDQVQQGRRDKEGHKLSLFDGESWIEEQRAALAGGGESK